MKKVAIAAAVAGAFATNATAAELSTSIYQEISLNFNSDQTAGSTTVDSTSLDDAGSNNIGFSYSDDLGNGLGLIGLFQITANATGARSAGHDGVTNRDSFIGLTGDFGKITFGTHELVNELEYILRDGWDANYGFLGGSAYGTSFVGRTGLTISQNYGDTIEWTSQSMNGMTLNAAYISGNDTETATVDHTGVEANILYTSGALKLSAGILDHSDIAVTTSNSTAGNYFEATRVSASYDFGSFSVAGSTLSMESKVGSTQADQDSRHINFTMPTASGRFIANYTTSGDQTINGTKTANTGYAGWDVGYMHDTTANAKMFVRYGSRTLDSGYSSSSGSETTNETLQVGLRYTY
jgi:predicted porin